jgi:hypothetical protein
VNGGTSYIEPGSESSKGAAENGEGNGFRCSSIGVDVSGNNNDGPEKEVFREFSFDVFALDIADLIDRSGNGSVVNNDDESKFGSPFPTALVFVTHGKSSNGKLTIAGSRTLG